MKRMMTQLPEVTCSFRSDSLKQQITNALFQHQFAVVTDLPVELQMSIDVMFKGCNAFFNQVHQIDVKPYIEPHAFDDPRGLMLPSEAFAGQINAIRYFFSLDKHCKIKNKNIPVVDGEDILSDAVETFSGFGDHLKNTALQGIEDTLGLVDNTLLQYTQGTSLVNVNRSYPFTQPRIRELYQHGNLLVEQDSYRIAQLPFHRDVSPVSTIAYPENHTGGLEMVSIDASGKRNIFVMDELRFDQQVMFLFTGRTLTELTNKHTSAIRHGVMTSPHEQFLESQKHPNQFRQFAGYFSFFNAENISPASTKNGTLLQPPTGLYTAANHYPVKLKHFISSYGEHMGKRMAALKPSECPEDLIAQYPASARFEHLYSPQLDLTPDNLPSAEDDGLALKLT